MDAVGVVEAGVVVGVGVGGGGGDGDGGLW